MRKAQPLINQRICDSYENRLRIFVNVSVIIVTYNSAPCIEACLASVAAQEGVTLEIIVVDNASTDNTVALVQRFGSVRLLSNKENIGFGRANNQAFGVSQGGLVYLLNPDSHLPECDTLARLCAALKAHDRWGMAGNRILSLDGTEESRPNLRYPGQRHVRRDFSKLPGEIAWVLGASMLIRREIYAALGGFDPGFFLYCEDTDLGLRVREIGHEVGFIPEVTVRHVGGASEHGNDPYDVCKRKMTSMLRFRQKHYSLEDALWLARRDLFRARFRMIWYSLRTYLQPAPSVAWRKHRQYRAVWEISTRVLDQQQGG